jgi:hypothetical protein
MGGTQGRTKMYLYGNEVTNIVLRKVNHDDYPRYVDTYVESAEYVDGLTLTDTECELLTAKMHENGTMQEMCADLLCQE